MYVEYYGTIGNDITIFDVDGAREYVYSCGEFTGEITPSNITLVNGIQLGNDADQCARILQQILRRHGDKIREARDLLLMEEL
jgi:hypothetical protein